VGGINGRKVSDAGLLVGAVGGAFKNIVGGVYRGVRCDEW
jgi:hypothetical protein